MRAELIPLYQSPNGDRWLLGEDPEMGRKFVIHRANEPSGGTVTEIELEDFLARDQGGPEHQELARLIHTLIESPE